MSSCPRGSGPDRSSIPRDHTMQKLLTSTTTKTDGPLPMTSMQTAGKQQALTPMKDISIIIFTVCLAVVIAEAWSQYRPVDQIQGCIPASHLLPPSPVSPTISFLSAQCTGFKNRWKRTCRCLWRSRQQFRAERERETGKLLWNLSLMAATSWVVTVWYRWCVALSFQNLNSV